MKQSGTITRIVFLPRKIVLPAAVFGIILLLVLIQYWQPFWLPNHEAIDARQVKQTALKEIAVSGRFPEIGWAVKQLDPELFPGRLEYLARRGFSSAGLKTSLLNHEKNWQRAAAERGLGVPLLEKNPQNTAAELSDKDLVSQLFLFSVSGTQLTEKDRKFLKEYPPAGLMLFKFNVSAEMEKFSREVQDANPDNPVLMTIDQEGGLVKRIWWDPTPAAPEMKKFSPEKQGQFYRQRDRLLYTLGLNWNLGFIADVSKKHGGFLEGRTLSSDYETASELISIAVRNSNLTLSTLKHFPGHGAVDSDSHRSVGIIEKTKETWLKEDARPFLAGIEAGADSIMIGHLKLSWLDKENPASLSPKIYELLRKDFNFRGITVTDDMIMTETAGYTREKSLELALEAGADVIMYSIADDKERKDILNFSLSLLKKGLITRRDMEARAARIISAKNTRIRLKSFVPSSIFY